MKLLLLQEAYLQVFATSPAQACLMRAAALSMRCGRVHLQSMRAPRKPRSRLSSPKLILCQHREKIKTLHNIRSCSISHQICHSPKIEWIRNIIRITNSSHEPGHPGDEVSFPPCIIHILTTKKRTFALVGRRMAFCRQSQPKTVFDCVSLQEELLALSKLPYVHGTHAESSLKRDFH